LGERSTKLLKKWTYITVSVSLKQGIRDGRAEVFDAVDTLEGSPELSHRNPGRPRKKK